VNETGSLQGLHLIRFAGYHNKTSWYLGTLGIGLVTAAAVLYSPVAGLCILAVGFLILCFVKPELGLVAATLAVPWQRTDFPGTRWVSGVAVLGGVIAWLRPYMVGHEPTDRTRIPGYMWFAIALLFYSLVSFLVRASLQPRFHLTGLGGLIYGTMSAQAVALAVVVGGMANSKRAVRLVLMTSLLQASVISVIGLQELFTNKTLVEFFWWTSRSYVAMGRRVSSIFYDPNLFANYSAPMLFLAIGVLGLGRTEVQIRRAALGCLALGVPAFAFTMSASNFIGVLAGLAAVWLCTRNIKIGIVTLALTGLAIVFITCPSQALPERLQPLRLKVDEAIESHYSEKARSGSIWRRARMIALGLELFQHNPWTGAGYGAFQTTLTDNPFAPVSRKGVPMLYPHNSYVLLLSELGLLGIAIFVGFLWLLMATAVSNMRRLGRSWRGVLQGWALAGIIQTLVFSWAYGSLCYNLNLWFLVGLTTALSHSPANDRA